MDSRDEILLNFQAMTGVEDVGAALQQLEASDWVLHVAVNVANALQASGRSASRNLPTYARMPPPEISPRLPGNSSARSHAPEEHAADFKLNITDGSSGRKYNLNFRPTHSVLNVKLDVGNVTNIAVSKQVRT